MKRAAALCAISSVLAFSALPARAADLGGNCCADIEERVAELEAITAKHGNKKMSVTITGQIDYGYLFLSGLGPNQRGVMNNPNSPSFLAVTGEAKMDKDWKAGFRVELGVDSRPPLSLSLTEAQPTIRVATAWLEAPVGTLTVGHGSIASDKTGQVSVANTVVASRMLSLAPLSNAALLGYDLPFNDMRRDSVRWDSPVIAGFIVSGSIANGDSFAGPIAIGFNTKNAWDAAIRYAGETKDAGGWRLAAAASYRDEQQVLSTFPILPFLNRSIVEQGSASLMNMSTGLFVNLAAGHVTNDTLWGTFTAYQVQAGIEKKIFKVGATTAFVEYGEMRLSGATPKLYGVGLVQAIDGLSVDLYADWKRYTTTDLGASKDVDAVMLGFRVKY